VRRVAVTLKLYGIDYEHAAWSGFGDVERIATYNPLRRVPTLMFDDGAVMVDSGSIVEVLDDMAPAPFLDRTGIDRRDMLRIGAFAAGVADKGVSLVYERAFREGLPMWVERCEAQVNETLDLLEDERGSRGGEWLFGDTMSHADVILGTMFRFMTEALPGQFDMDGWNALSAHAAACEALPEFAAAYQAYRLAMPGE
jgi:glutathione S-transferase